MDIINTMPDEILLEICKHLRFTTMGTLAQVCRNLKRFAEDEVLWRKMFLEMFPEHFSLPPPSINAISWRMAFKRLYDEDCTVVTADEDTKIVQPKLRKRRGWLLSE